VECHQKSSTHSREIFSTESFFEANKDSEISCAPLELMPHSLFYFLIACNHRTTKKEQEKEKDKKEVRKKTKRKTREEEISIGDGKQGRQPNGE